MQSQGEDLHNIKSFLSQAPSLKNCLQLTARRVMYAPVATHDSVSSILTRIWRKHSLKKKKSFENPRRERYRPCSLTYFMTLLANGDRRCAMFLIARNNHYLMLFN